MGELPSPTDEAYELLDPYTRDEQDFRLPSETDGSKLLAQFKTHDHNPDLLVYKESGSDGEFFIELDGHKNPKTLGFRSMGIPYSMAIINYDAVRGYVPYYKGAPPEIYLHATPSEPYERYRRYTYLVHRYYGSDGTLEPDPTHLIRLELDRLSKANYRIDALSRLGIFRESELPNRINMQATIQTFEAQVRGGNFSQPKLIE